MYLNILSKNGHIFNKTGTFFDEKRGLKTKKKRTENERE